MSSFDGYRSGGGDRRKRNGSSGNGRRRGGQFARKLSDLKLGRKGRVKFNKRGGKPQRVGHRGGGFEGGRSRDFVEGLKQGLEMRIGHRM